MAELASIRIVRHFVEELGGAVIATQIGKHAKLRVMTAGGVHTIVAPISPSDHRWALQARAYVRRLFPSPKLTVPPPKRRVGKKRCKADVGKPFRSSSTCHAEPVEQLRTSWHDALARLKSKMESDDHHATSTPTTLPIPLSNS